MFPAIGMGLNPISALPDAGRFISFGQVLYDAGNYIFRVFSQFIQGIKQTHERVQDNQRDPLKDNNIVQKSVQKLESVALESVDAGEQNFCEKINLLISGTQEKIRSLFDLSQNINSLKDQMQNIDKERTALTLKIKNQTSNRRVLTANQHFYRQAENNIKHLNIKLTSLNNSEKQLNRRLYKLQIQENIFNNIFNKKPYSDAQTLFNTISRASDFQYQLDTRLREDSTLGVEKTLGKDATLLKKLNAIETITKKLRKDADIQKSTYNINTTEHNKESVLYDDLIMYLDEINKCIESWKHKIDIIK
jgi:hypothetical protein